MPQPEESYGDHLVTDWAIEQMKQPGDKPLFLAVGLFRPHIPWEVSKRWFDLYPLDEVQLPKHLQDDMADAHSHGRQGWHKWVTDNNQWKKFMQGYLASISYVDHQLGRLLDALDASPMKDNTVIVLWSDHGFHIGEKQNWGNLPCGIRRLACRFLCMLRGESRWCLHATADDLTDIYPTLCELAGCRCRSLHRCFAGAAIEESQCAA